MAYDSSQIFLEPRYPWIKFIDGYSAKVMSMRPIHEGGKDMWLMTLMPTNELVKRYELKTNEPYLNKIYPIEVIKQLSNDPAWTEYFSFYTWDGKKTPVSDMFTGFAYIHEITELKDKIESLKSQVAKLSYNLDLANTNIGKYIQSNYGIILESLGPALSRIVQDSLSNPIKSGAGI